MPNFAGLNKAELIAAIHAAPTAAALAAIDADLAREGWAPDGVVRSIITDRRTALETHPHAATQPQNASA